MQTAALIALILITVLVLSIAVIAVSMLSDSLLYLIDRKISSKEYKEFRRDTRK